MSVNIRKPAVAGSFYDSNKNKLSDFILSVISQSGRQNLKHIPKIFIVPHAGYSYSGEIAVKGLAPLLQVKDTVKRVVIIGPSHHVGFKGLAVPSCLYFSTPLGDVRVDKESIKSISEFVTVSDEAHKEEHSIEVQIPILQCLLDDFSIIPIAAGDVSFEWVSKVIEFLWGGCETIFVISTDLSHYHPYEDACVIDKESSGFILNKQTSKLNGKRACGFLGLGGALNTAKKFNLNIIEVERKNSGDVSGDKKNSVVGYGSYHIGNLFMDIEYNNEYKKFLLNLARDSIIYGLKHGECMSEFEDKYQIGLQRATFVTLKKDGELRGCIGSLIPVTDIAHDVVRNAYNAAFKDTRFTPVSIEEVDDIVISISVLTVPVPMSFSSENDLLSQIKPGESGLILYEGRKSGTFLPSVWEDIKDKKEFLRHLKVKTGLPPDYWSDTIKCSCYTTVSFSE